MRAAPHKIALVDCAQSGAVVAAAFHAPKTIDQTVRKLFLPRDAYNAAHELLYLQSSKYKRAPL